MLQNTNNPPLQVYKTMMKKRSHSVETDEDLALALAVESNEAPEVDLTTLPATSGSWRKRTETAVELSRHYFTLTNVPRAYLRPLHNMYGSILTISICMELWLLCVFKTHSRFFKLCLHCFSYHKGRSGPSPGWWEEWNPSVELTLVAATSCSWCKQADTIVKLARHRF